MKASQTELRKGRKRALDTPDRTPRVDHGTAGPAMRARASTLVETVEAGVRVRWMEDDTPIAHYRRTGLLTDRQCDALCRLAEHYEEAGRRHGVVAGYGNRITGKHEMSDAQAKAWADYCHLLDRAPPTCRHALALVASSEFPAFANHLALLRQGATALADHLRYDY